MGNRTPPTMKRTRSRAMYLPWDSDESLPYGPIHPTIPHELTVATNGENLDAAVCAGLKRARPRRALPGTSGGG